MLKLAKIQSSAGTALVASSLPPRPVSRIRKPPWSIDSRHEAMKPTSKNVSEPPFDHHKSGWKKVNLLDALEKLAYH